MSDRRRRVGLGGPELAPEPLMRHVTWAVLLNGVAVSVSGSLVTNRPGAPLAWATLAALVLAAVAYRTQRWRLELLALPLVGMLFAALVTIGWQESLRSPLAVGLLVAVEAALARRATGITAEVNRAVKMRLEVRRLLDGDGGARDER